MTIPRCTSPVSEVDTEQMIEVDRAMIEDYRIELLQMMENAGRNLAHLARQRFLGGDPQGRRIVALAGTGGNGGGTMVAARRLHGWGAEVVVYVTRPGGLAPVPAHQSEILRRMGVPLHPPAALASQQACDLVLDGILGYSLCGDPRDEPADLIRWANQQAAPILALDIPSGIDAASGQVHDPAIRAAATMTLALPKRGLSAAGAIDHVGELYLADIGVPPALYASATLGLEVGALFATNDVVRLR